MVPPRQQAQHRHSITPLHLLFVCALLICHPFFFFFGILLSVSLSLWFELDRALEFRKAAIVLWKFNVPHGCLFFIINYRSNNLAANGAPTTDRDDSLSLRDCSETCLIFTSLRSGKKKETHTVVPNRFRQVEALWACKPSKTNPTLPPLSFHVSSLFFSTLCCYLFLPVYF